MPTTRSFVARVFFVLSSVLFAAPAVTAEEVERITVTATGRERSSQSVPLAVTAVTSEMLDKQGVTDIATLTTSVPSLFVNSSNTETGGSSIRLRGIGTTGNNAGLEGSVGVFQDGVYLSRPGIALAEFVDVERVEVILGPQGTLFGRNTSAGAITIKTREPDLLEASSYLNWSHGSYGQDLMTGAINLPVIDDTLGLRVAVGRNTRSGYLANENDRIKSNDRNRWLIRGQALWRPTDSTSLRVIADHFKANEKCCDGAISHESPFFAGLTASAPGLFVGPTVPGDVTGVLRFGQKDGLQDLNTNVNRQRENDQKQWGVSGEFTWEGDDVDLTYIGSYREWDSHQSGDDDFTTLDIIDTRKSPNGVDLMTHELRLHGEVANVDWLVGGFYSDEEINAGGRLALGQDYENYVNLLLSALSGGLLSVNALTGLPLGTNFTNGATRVTGDNAYAQDGEAWSIFTHNEIGLTDAMRLTVGGRYTSETKRGSFTSGPGLSNPGCDGLIAQTRAGAGLNVAGALAGTAAGTICFPFVSSALPEFDQKFKDDQFSGTVKLSVDLTDETMGYASYSRGFKSGGFNLDSTAAITNALGATTIPALAANDADPGNYKEEGDASFKSETVNAVELGFKSDLHDNQVRLNVTGFFYDMNNFQVLEFTGVQFRTVNIEQARAAGFETDFRLRPHSIEGLELNTSVVYSNTRYGTKNGNNCGSGPTEQRVCGLRFTNAPLWTANFGASYEGVVPGTESLRLPDALGGGGVIGFIGANSQLRSHRRAGTTRGNPSVLPGGSEAPHARIQPTSFIVNARMGIQSDDQRWAFEIWARNLTDERTSTVRFAVPLRTGATGAFIDPPRMVGLTLRGAY